MISCTLFDDIGVCLLELGERLNEQDMTETSEAVNGYLADDRGFKGLVVHAEFFPWWDEFADLASHLRFSGDHHQAIERVAICSDIDMSGLLPKIGSHFSAAEVKGYKEDQVSEAMHWVKGE